MPRPAQTSLPSRYPEPLTYLAAVAAAAVFGFFIRFLRIVPVAREVVAVSRGAVACMRDPAISDLEKERAMQRASISLMRGFLSILGRSAAAVAAAALLLLALDAIRLARLSAVTDLLATWQGIVLTTVAMILVWYVGLRR